jgi:hypothetical protein
VATGADGPGLDFGREVLLKENFVSNFEESKTALFNLPKDGAELPV